MADYVPEITVIDISPASEEYDGTPLRPIYCVKKKINMKAVEEREDCFILDFDPDDDETFDLNVSKDQNADSDISVVAEKGKVACRDYPHSRHLCLKYPFETMPHDRHCVMCYCYVCDVAAPCKNWSGQNGHCHAIDNEAWEIQRRFRKQLQQTINSLS